MVEFLDYEDLSKLINIAIATTKISKLETPSGKEIRPFMHMLLYGRIGSGKSTILGEVGKNLNQTNYMGLTKATLIGAVDTSTGIFSPPAVWDSRNSALLIDDYTVSKNDGSGRALLNSLLSLMEMPEYRKRIGYRCNDFEEVDGNLFCKVKNNTIHCRTRFLLFINTMMNLRQSQMPELNALMTRCLLIPYYPSIEDIKRKLRGEPHFIYEPVKIKNFSVKMRTPQFERIIKMVDDAGTSSENYLRLVGDLCRAYAVLGKFDNKTFELIIKLAKGIGRSNERDNYLRRLSKKEKEKKMRGL